MINYQYIQEMLCTHYHMLPLLSLQTLLLLKNHGC